MLKSIKLGIHKSRRRDGILHSDRFLGIFTDKNRGEDEDSIVTDPRRQRAVKIRIIFKK